MGTEFTAAGRRVRGLDHQADADLSFWWRHLGRDAFVELVEAIVVNAPTNPWARPLIEVRGQLLNVWSRPGERVATVGAVGTAQPAGGGTETIQLALRAEFGHDIRVMSVTGTAVSLSGELVSLRPEEARRA